MHLTPASPERVERARALSRAYALLDRVPAARRGSRSAIDVVAVGLPAEAEVQVLLRGRAVLKATVSRAGGEEALGRVTTRSGATTLGVEVVQARSASWVRSRVQIAPGTQRLEIRAANPYPPRLLLGGDVVNPVPGLHLRERRRAASRGADYTSPVFVVDATADLLDLPSAPMDIWIDDMPVANPEPRLVLITMLAVHAQRLAAGPHRLRVGLPESRRVVLDTALLSNGIDDVQVFVTRLATGHARVALWQGPALLLEESTNASPGDQGTVVVSGEVGADIDPKDVPKDLDRAKLKAARDSAAKLRDNYRAFLDARARARAKKAKGEGLTPEERDADGIGTDKQLDDWLKRRKKAEGYDLITAGTTSASGESKYELPEPTTAWEKFQRAVILDVHEASHRRACEADAKALGLDWDKLQRVLDAAEHQTSPPNDLLDWLHENLPAVRKYLRRRGDPDHVAEEEIREYEDEIRVYDGLLLLK